MYRDLPLLVLVLLTIVLGVLLILASGAAFGRILADLEYQYAAGLNGVRRIQSRVNLRTHGNRVILGVFALVTGILALVNVDPFVRTWVTRALFILVLIGYATSSIFDWLDEQKCVRILIRERQAAGGGFVPEPTMAAEEVLPTAATPEEVPM